MGRGLCISLDDNEIGGRHGKGGDLVLHVLSTSLETCSSMLVKCSWLSMLIYGSERAVKLLQFSTPPTPPASILPSRVPHSY